MRGTLLDAGGITLYVRDTGPAKAPTLVLLHALGTDMRLWEGLLERLPEGLRVIAPDMRGHGLSDCPAPPYPMGTLVSDAEAVLDGLGVRKAVVLGLSIGGLIAQGLAVKRLDLVRGLILSNTAAKIGTPAQWQERIDAVTAGGLEALADGTMERWFAEPYRSGQGGRLARQLFLAQRAEGWAGCAAAISGTDLYTPTSGLRLPTLGIAGDRDGSTPPDLVRETVGLIPGSRMELLRGAGHVPCLDATDAYADAILGFLSEIGHL